jgi:ribonuclease E
VLESTMQPCPQCGGTGHIRSDSSVALLVLRAIEEALLKDNRHHITVKTPQNTALYILNHKRRNLSDLEAQFGLDITIESDDSVAAQHYIIIKGAVSDRPAAPELAVIDPPALDVDDIDDDVAEEIDEPTVEAPRHTYSQGENDGEGGDGQRKKRRRRRRRGGRGRGGDQNAQVAGGQDQSQQDHDGPTEGADAEEGAEAAETAVGDTDEGPRKRRRGKRGGRRNKGDNGPVDGETSEQPSEEVAAADSTEPVVDVVAPAPETPDTATEEPKPKRKRKAPAKAAEEAAAAVEAKPDAAGTEAEDGEAKKPARKRKAPARKKAADTVASEPVVSVISGGEQSAAETSEGAPAEDQDNQSRRSGWWQRKSFF